MHQLEVGIDRFSPLNLAFNFGSHTTGITHDGEFSNVLIELDGRTDGQVGEQLDKNMHQ